MSNEKRESKSQIKKTIFTKKFRDFCKKEFAKSMNELEKERLNILNIRKLIIILCIFWIIGNLITSLLIFQNITSCVFQNSIFGIIATIIISSFLSKRYKTKAKKLVLGKLLSFVGDFKVEVNLSKFCAESMWNDIKEK